MIDYCELASRVNETERGLEALGVGSGDVVAVLLENGLAFAEIVHAIAQCGAVLLPLNTRLTPRELAFQLEESATRLLIHGPGPLADLAASSALLIGANAALDRVEVDADGSPALEPGGADRIELPARRPYIDPARRPHVDPARTLALVYTSGTTGSPKGARLSHRNLFWNAIGSTMHLGFRSEDRWLVCMPLYHVGGLSILLRSVLCGSSAILHERFDPEAVNRALDEDGVTLVSWVPAMLERVLAARGERRAPHSLRCVLLGGGPAPRELLERARSQGFPIAATYGLTEASSQVATQLPTLAESDGVAGLRPIFGAQLDTVDDDGKSVRGRPGEILVRGPAVMEGYWNRPEETASALRGGWLHTGDIGVLDSSDTLEVLERRCDLIISGGENVYPGEIEAVLLEHPAVIEAAVAGRADAEYGRRPIAWLVAAPGRQLDLADVRRVCAERLAAYKIPLAFTVVDELPRNSAGKLVRERIT
jgi:O-succinylbenzoic acid--CoA ligase